MRKLLVLFSLLAATAPAGEWMTSGGNPARTGLSDEYAPGGPDLLWSGTLSGWFGLPIFISADKLVTMRFQSIDYAPMVCHDLFTGETLWTRDFPGANSRSVPIGLRDSRVYAINFQESRHDTLYCLDADNGEILWRGRVTVEMSISESATFAENGDLLVNASDFKIARIDHADGDTVWTTYRLWPVTGSADICVYESHRVRVVGRHGHTAPGRVPPVRRPAQGHDRASRIRTRAGRWPKPRRWSGRTAPSTRTRSATT